MEFVVTEHGLWYRNNVLNLDKITAKIPKEVAVLTLMGEKDDLTQPERDAPLWNRAYGARDHTLLVLPGCSHYYLEKFEQDLAGKAIFGWLEKQVPVSVGTHEAAKL